MDFSTAPPVRFPRSFMEDSPKQLRNSNADDATRALEDMAVERHVLN